MTDTISSALRATTLERVNRARADMRAGVPVAIGEHVFIAAETLTKSRLEALSAFGPVFIAITQRRAETLRARAYDGDIARIEAPNAASLSWISSIADPASDLIAPMKGPLKTRRGTDAQDARLAVQLAKSSRLLPSVVGCALENVSQMVSEHAWLHLTCEELAEVFDATSSLTQIVAAKVPLSVSEESRVLVFRPEDGGEEHYAIEIGRPDRRAPVLTRLHSACFTGDLLGSLKCDCGAQLRTALDQMANEGSGVLLYLNQEGRGIGLANKMRAYSLQDQGFDTVEANHRLGFEDDERDFRLGATILKSMGYSSARLMTNNPAKVAMLETNNVKVTERVPLRVGQTSQNADYLATKARKSGHIL